MTIASEIARLQAAKVDIMAALVEKGVDVIGKNLVDVPNLIDSIEVSSFPEFLTYFNSYDRATKIDNPLKGSKSQSYTGSVDNPVTTNLFNGMQLSSFQANNGLIKYPIGDINSDFTFEFFFSRTAPGGKLDTLSINLGAFNFNAYYQGNRLRSFVRSLNIENYTYSLFNDWYDNGIHSWNKNEREFSMDNKWAAKPLSNHVAFVKNGNTLTLFYNGALCFILRNCETSFEASELSIQWNTNDTYAITQISLRKGDYSNNGESFTVPIYPYQ